MSPENLLRDVYARYAEGDLDGALALCHEDVAFIMNPTNTHAHFMGVFKRVDAFRNRQIQVVSSFDYDSFEPIEIFGTDDKAVSRVAVRLTAKETGITVESEIVHIITARDGKISEVREYADTELLERAMTSRSTEG